MAAESSALPLNLKKKTVILNSTNISQYYHFYCIFGQINVALVSIRDLFQKQKQKKRLNCYLFVCLIKVEVQCYLRESLKNVKVMLTARRMTIFVPLTASE